MNVHSASQNAPILFGVPALGGFLVRAEPPKSGTPKPPVEVYHDVEKND